MQFSSFMEWIALGFLSSFLYIFWELKNSVREMKESVIELNGKIALLFEKDEQSKKQLEDHEDRLRELENN